MVHGRGEIHSRTFVHIFSYTYIILLRSISSEFYKIWAFTAGQEFHSLKKSFGLNLLLYLREHEYHGHVSETINQSKLISNSSGNENSSLLLLVSGRLKLCVRIDPNGKSVKILGIFVIPSILSINFIESFKLKYNIIVSLRS